MLVALTITLAVTAGALTLALSSRRMFELDETRTRLNQSLRGSKDFLVNDVRQAGERLGGGFPAIEIVPGASGAPDELIVRRNLIETVLRSCHDLGGSDDRIHIAELVDPPPPGCVLVPDGNGDGWSDNLEVWREMRLASSVTLDGQPALLAYIYDPAAGLGEFFWYGSDDSAGAYIETASGHTWTNNYPLAHECQLFVIEERRYRLEGDVLQLIVNRDTANPLNLVDGIADFQLRALFRIPPPPALPVEPPPQEFLGVADDWTSLRAVEVTVLGRLPFRGRTLEREWSSEVLPRNVLSR